MSKPNILVITQHADTQNEFKTILGEDYEHLAALNGIDGVAISRMARPSVIFVDHQAAQLSAEGVCKSLSSHETVKTIPVFVLAESETVNGAFTSFSNFGGVIQPPLQAEQIRAKIQSSLQAAPAGAAPATPKPVKKRDEPIRVLSVDDSSVVQKLVTMILTAEGFKVTTASDGLDGINKAKEIKPDIILLDFVMPKMNGFQVCRILQKDEKLRQIPVILVTSKGDKVGDKFVDQLGVTGYITKPFQPEELVTKIHQTLEAPEAEEAVPAAPAAPATPAAPAQAAQVQPAAPAASAPAASADAIKSAVQAEVSRVLAEEFETKVAELVKTEVAKALKSIDKRIEKAVIEKMNEYIRRAKKK